MRSNGAIFGFFLSLVSLVSILILYLVPFGLHNDRIVGLLLLLSTMGFMISGLTIKVIRKKKLGGLWLSIAGTIVGLLSVILSFFGLLSRIE